MPNTVPRLLGMGLGSGDVSALESGDSLVIRAVFDRPVRVRTSANEPSIGLTINGTTRRAVFHRVVSPPRFRNYGSNVGSAIEFAYTMQASDAEASEITVTRNSLRATGGASIVSATGGARPALTHSQFVLRDDRWNAHANSGEPLTATLESVPSSHDGETAFTVRVQLSEAIATGYEAVRDHAFTLTNAQLTNASRVDGQSDLWQLDIEPDSDADVTLSVAANRECTESGALCTADGRSLSNALEATIAGPVETTAEEQVETTGLTASFENVPASHTGSGTISLRLSLDAALSTSWKGVQHSLAIANGTLTRTHRVGGRSDLWGIVVAPTGDDDVTVRLNASADCADPEKTMCASDGRRLEAAISTVIPGPAPLTASFVNMPSGHDGSSFTFRILFSEPISIGWKTIRDSSVRVTQGGRTAGAAGARRVDGRNDLWEIAVNPASGADIAIGLGPTGTCTDTGAMCTSAGKALSSGLQANVIGPPGLSVADARVREAANATVDFTVALSRAAAATVTVDYATSDGTATAGSDYTAASGTLSFAPGELTKTVSVAVIEDQHDEDEETFTLTLSNASGNNVWLSDATATGTIENTDAMPQAWIARFGRTVTGQVVEAVEARLTAPREAGARLALAGQALPSWQGGAERTAAFDADAADRESMDAVRIWLSRGEPEGDASVGNGRALSDRDFLTGTSFALTAGGREAGGFATLWGRASVAGFDGREGDLTLDGEVTTGLVGADWAAADWTAGLAVGHSRGTGDYRSTGDEPNASGKVEAVLTGLYPYIGLWLGDGLTAWATGGSGSGDLTLEYGDGTRVETDLSMFMGAAGLRGEVLRPENGAGLALAVKGDMRFSRTSSKAATDSNDGKLAAAEGNVWLMRAGVEGSRALALGGGAVLTPGFEIGMRLDGGDAETGFGADIGGGLTFADASRGLSVDLKARGLIAHEASGFREWGASAGLGWVPRPGSDRGPSLRLSQSLGGSSQGGMDALLGSETLAGLAANDNGAGDGGDELRRRRLDLRLGYGLSALGDRFTSTPELGLGLSNDSREMSLGWRLNLTRGGPVSLELGLAATRREQADGTGDAEHAIGFRMTARF